MSQYDSAIKSARRLLAKFGQSLTFTRDVPGAYDPVAGEYAPGTTIQVTGNGVLLNYQNSEVDGTVIQMGDSKCILELTASPPAIDDRVTANGKTWRVMQVAPLSPAGQDVIYTLQLRAG